MLTKEDYMKLDKERLAELLVERDVEDKNRQPFVFPEFPATPPVNPVKYPYGTPLCPLNGGACTNPFRDCVNCPGVISTGGGNYQWQTDTKATTGTTFLDNYDEYCYYGGVCTDPYRNCAECPGLKKTKKPYDWETTSTTLDGSISCSVNDDEKFNSSTTIQPNKYGSITPTDAEGLDSYEWIYNKGFQDGVKQAEEKMKKRLEEEWEKGNDVGYEDGGDDMLMQMPHWKKADAEANPIGIRTNGIINGILFWDKWWVDVDELKEKLPRDEGTIYCDRAHIDYVNEEEGIEEDESIAEGCDEWNKFYNKYKNKKK